MTTTIEDEEEKKRKSTWFWDTIVKALKDAREMLPDAMQDSKGIVGSIFSMIMQGVEYFKKIFAHFSLYPANSRYNLSSEELQAEDAQAFLNKIQGLNLDNEQRIELLDKWRQDPKDRSLAWVALAEHGLAMGEKGMDSAQSIIDERLVVIKNKVTVKDSPENIADPDLAREFKNEILLIEMAELEQIEHLAKIQRERLEKDDDTDYESLLKAEKDRLKNILEMGTFVITRHYEIYKKNASSIPAPAVVQDNRPDRDVLHEEFDTLNRRLNRA